MSEQEDSFVQLVNQGMFRVDQLGRIWRLAVRTRTGRLRPVSARRCEEVRPDGYSRVRTQVDGVQLSILAHRLVWLYLISGIPAGLEVNHRNGARSDNRPSNLELLTPGGNLQHAYTVLGRVRASGERNGRHKLTADQVRQIHAQHSSGVAKRAIAREFGVTPPMIRRILGGRAWRDEFPAVAS